MVGTVNEISNTAAQAYVDPNLTSKGSHLSKEELGMRRTRYSLFALEAPPDKIDKLTKGIYAAHIVTGIDPVLIGCIISTESEFNPSAKSPMGYKGLMQTPHSHMSWRYAETDIIEGSLDLKEKLRISKGDLTKALTFYKGSTKLMVKDKKTKKSKKSNGYKQALEVLELYNKTKKTIKPLTV